MSGERISVWDDPRVKRALKERPLSEIEVLNCPSCGQVNYYNLGFHYTCRHCDKTWHVLFEDEELPIDGRRYMRPDVILTLEDVSQAECEDY
jgi:hypothetical protein